jgi:hypothetical protein
MSNLLAAISFSSVFCVMHASTILTVISSSVGMVDTWTILSREPYSAT